MIGTPGVNLHAPGPIGDTTPSTIGGTTLSLISPTTQITSGVDGSNQMTITTAANGLTTFNIIGGLLIWQFNVNGTGVMSLANNQIINNQANGGIFATGDNSNFIAARVRLGVDAGIEGGSGLGCRALGNPTIIAGGSIIGEWTSTLFTLAVPLKVPGGTSPLLTSATAITSGGAAALGTLANAPTAGNPTKWFPINDNGTTRYVPAW